MTIVAFVPGADKKLLVNIMKRREPAKRKKADMPEVEMDGEAEEEEETTKKSNKETRSGCIFYLLLY